MLKAEIMISFADTSFGVMKPQLRNDIPNEAQFCVDIETIKKITIMIIMIITIHVYKGKASQKRGYFYQ